MFRSRCVPPAGATAPARGGAGRPKPRGVPELQQPRPCNAQRCRGFLSHPLGWTWPSLFFLPSLVWCSLSLWARRRQHLGHHRSCSTRAELCIAMYSVARNMSSWLLSSCFLFTHVSSSAHCFSQRNLSVKKTKAEVGQWQRCDPIHEWHGSLPCMQREHL